MNGTTSLDTLKLLKEAHGNPLMPDKDLLEKLGITTATGLVNYDLQAPAQSLIPVITPIRNMLPRVPGNGGTATNWKQVTAINSASISAGVSEGNRGGIVSTTVVDKVAIYKGIGLEDYVTFEADYAGQGFEDVRARATLNLLRSVMLQEEAILVGGNNSLALGVTPALTLAASAIGGLIGASITVAVRCIALTMQGFATATVAAGVRVGPISRTNADGSIDTFGSGAAQKSAKATVAVSAGVVNSVTAIVTPVNGAVAYAWFVGDDAAPNTEKLYSITTINSAKFTAIPVAGQLATDHPASDQSQNSLVFDGLITQASTVGSGAYIARLATGTPGTGTPLTSDGAAGIVEITAAFRYFWDNYKVGPDTIWASAQELQNITAKVIANGGAPLLRMTADANASHASITGGVLLGSILNPFTQEMVRLRIHPTLPPGTILFTTSSIPYPLSGVGNVMQVKTRRDYHQIDWPLRSRKNEYGVYADEVLQHYATFTLGLIQNVANG